MTLNDKRRCGAIFGVLGVDKWAILRYNNTISKVRSADELPILQ